MAKIVKLLVANRGEIAVRIIKVAQEAGIATVAVYANQDRNALYVRLADQAYTLNGGTARETYLSSEKILSIAVKSGANAIHPGYGFLSESPEFAQAVLDAGLIWVGPPPSSIRLLGDKASAREIAEKVGAPLTPGSKGPVSTAEDIVAFANEYGLPLAIKASFGGGGRGLKVAHTLDQIPALFESATREAFAAFGRGECFVEKYLDKPRHIEAQCLADASGKVVVISTRDCSLQRRHQKLVEEAPAPFLSGKLESTIYKASKNILRAAGYIGAGTCEFLLSTDGSLSFLEVNTRLQVEHPVSEEVTGIDLVSEQLRIAQGELIDYDDPAVVGHAIEFRVNAEDAGLDFVPSIGQIGKITTPTGEGVRIDSGICEGDRVSEAFDSLLAKLIIVGKDRKEAISRAKKALEEFEIEGISTVIPFHRQILTEPAFVAGTRGEFSVHTRWIQEDFRNSLSPFSGHANSVLEESLHYENFVFEIGGERLEVGIPPGITAWSSSGESRIPPRRKRRSSPLNSTDQGLLTSPMQATVIQIKVEVGEIVSAGDLICVLEAMKMEQPVYAPIDGTLIDLQIVPGQTVVSGGKLATIVPLGFTNQTME